MNQDQSSLSEVLFFGMCLKAGREEVYSIENEEGQMEICHLTNCALVSESTSSKPIYVRMKNPDVDSEFVIGALVPGKVYSFQTDLLITPDTKFSHSGGPEDEVHLTGYRTVNSDSMFMGEDLDDSDDEMDEEAEDEEDDDFVVNDGNVDGEAEDESAEDEDSSEEEGQSDHEETPDEQDKHLQHKDIRGKADIKEEKEFRKVLKERAKAREKLLKLHDQANDIVPHPDSIDMHIKALEGRHPLAGESSDDSEDDMDDEDLDEEDLEPPVGEEVDDDDEVQRHMAEMMAEDGNSDSEGGDDDEEEEEEDTDGDMENSGAAVRVTRSKQQASTQAGVKGTRGSHKLIPSKGTKSAMEEKQAEDDEDADPSTRAKAVTLARQQQDKIEREKQKQMLNGARKGGSEGTAAQGPTTKKRKASVGQEADENSGIPPKKAAKGLSHPRSANFATQKFAADIHHALTVNGKAMTMAALSQKVKKPQSAEKLGKVVAKYECFTRSKGDKSADIVSLAE